MSIKELLEASDRMGAIIAWHLAMPLVDHDGGDEDDRLVEERRFLRACRQPRAAMFLHGKRLFVIQRPDPMVPLLPIRFGDPGDEQP